MRSNLLWAVIFLATLGVVDTAYLSYARFSHSALSCDFLEGCNLVAASPESVLFGVIPLAYLGLGFYIAVFLLGVVLVARESWLARWMLLLVGSGGLIASVYFTFVQATVINSFCVYCLASAVISGALFFVILRFYRQKPLTREMGSIKNRIALW